MKRLALLCTVISALACCPRAIGAAELKAFWVTGGCCHDYKKHAPLLQEKMQQYASVSFKTRFCNSPEDMSPLKDKDYAKGYDVVVYDLCFADVKDKDLIGNMTRTIRQGKPAVFIHCSLHNFRAIDWDDWREAMGLTSKSHDGFRAISTKKATDHAIIKFWPADWKTPGDELYQNIKFWPRATALLTAYSVDSKKDHVVAWTNQYGKSRVFGTTLGHNVLTVDQDEYQHLLANGLLWVCGKLDAEGQAAPGYAGRGKK
ncbi:MAG: ThuA domain-containing protein [Thermoguttaceae bacterium]|jgi:type 1 glutamine amidotransferase